MLATLFFGTKDRLRISLRPSTLARSLFTAAVVVAIMPVIAVGMFLLVSLATPALSATAVGAVLLGVSSTVVLYGTAGILLLFGVLLASFVQVGAHADSPRLLRLSWARAIRAFPRLVGAIVALCATFIAATAFWPIITLGMLVIAVVVFVRAERGASVAPVRSGVKSLWRRVPAKSRRALVWAIPLVPALVSLALLVAVLPASLAAPTSFRQLFALAWARMRTLQLLAITIVGGVVTAGASLGGVYGAVALDPTNGLNGNGPFLASLAVLIGAVLVVQVVVGATVAIFTTDATSRLPRARPRLSIRSVGALMSRGTKPAIGRVAMVAITALVITIAPMPAYAVGEAAPGTSSTGETPQPVAPESTAAQRVAVSDASMQSAGTEATVVTATLYNLPAELGGFLDIVVQVTAPNAPQGTVVPGRVNVWAGEQLLGNIEQSAYGAFWSLNTTGMTPGDVQLRIEYPGQDGFAPSESFIDITLGKAWTNVTGFVFGDDELTWGDTHTHALTIWAAYDEPRVMDTFLVSNNLETLISSVPFTIVDGRGDVLVDLTGLLPGGTPTYTLRVRETDHARTGYVGDYFTKTVSSATTALALSATDPSGAVTQGKVGEPMTITATVASPASSSTPGDGTVRFTIPYQNLDPVAVNDQGVASITFTPTNRQSITFSAEYLPNYTRKAYSGSSATLTVNPGGAVTGAPTASWNGKLNLTDTRLSVAYPSSGDFAPPTGTVTILDAAGQAVATTRGWGEPQTQFELSAGAITLIVPVGVGTHQYSVSYSGDSNYSPRADALPVVVVTPPVVTLTAQTPTYYSESTQYLIQVADVALGLVQGVTIYATDSDQNRTVVGTATYSSSTGIGYLRAVLAPVGSVTLTAEVVFTAASAVTSVSSTPQTIVVPAPFAPDVQVSIDSSTVWSASRRTVGVNVQALSAGRYVDVPSGTVAVIRDDLGVQVGTVTLTGSEPRGWVNIELTRSGTTGLTASVPYGPFGGIATSVLAELPAVVNGNATTFAVSSDTIGGDVSIDLTATVWGSPLDSTRAVTVVATFDGTEKTVTLTRRDTEIDRGWLGTVVFFDGTATFARPTSGYQPLTVTSAGNGADVSAIDYRGSIFIGTSATVLTVPPISGAVGGEPLEVTPIVTAVEEGGPNPTGTVRLLLKPSYATCEAPVESGCVFPGDAVRGGTNILSASYLGDTSNSPTGSSTVFSAQERTTVLEATFSVAPDQWIVGESVTATWTTTTSGRPAVGLVTVVAGDATCSGIALSGSCSFAVAPDAVIASATGQPYSVMFDSFDDAPDQLITGFAVPRTCVVLRYWDASTEIDLDGAEPCHTQGQLGVIAGSTVKLTAQPLPTHYVFGRWQVNGIDAVTEKIGDLSASTIVTQSGYYSYTTDYAPRCFTLTVSPNAEIATGPLTRDDLKGNLLVYTKPNCSSPDTATDADLVEFDAGTPRYATGTIVEIRAEPAYERTTSQPYAIETFDGVIRAETNPEFGTVTMDADHTVSATFAVAGCVPFRLHQSAGGSASILSANRPESSRALKPATGDCTDPVGGPGYVRGTSVVIESIPDPEYAFTSLAYTREIPTDDQLTAAALAQKPETTGSTRTTVIIGEKSDRHVRPVFSHQDCVSVMVRVIGPRAHVTRSDSGVSLQGGSGDEECAPPRTVAAEQFDDYITVETVYSVLSTSVLVATPKYEWWPLRTDRATITWSTSYGATTVPSRKMAGGGEVADLVVRSPGMDYSTWGPIVALDQLPSTDREVLITATYVSRECATPTVVNPFGAPYQMRLTPGLTSVCSLPTEADRYQTVEVRAADSDIPTLKPVFSIERSAANNDGRAYLPNPATVPGTQTLALEYCAPLNLTVTMRDDAGTVRTLGSAEAARIVVDDGGCAPLNTRPAKTVTTSLTVEAAYANSIIDTPSVMPTLAVDARGISAPTTLNLRVNCVSVDVGDRTTRNTPANCPGGAANRYIKGTVVQFTGEVHDDEGLDGWNGVDEQNGVTAWVIAETDRYAAVDIDYPSVWDKISNGLSGLAQRIVSAAVIVATGIVLAKMMLAKMVTAALKSVGTIVAISGGGDGMLNAMTKVDNAVTAVMNTVELFSKCINTSAAGTGTLTALPSSTLTEPGANGVNDAISNTESAFDELADNLNGNGRSVGGTAAQVISSGRGLVDLFGSNTSLYGRDAGQAWTSMGTSLGGCMLTGLEDNAHLLLSHER
ncbi:Ig-like domain repeat protein [Cryobacterium aureum]|uniref:Ig-like domain repeat protein n=1 Tax=Cryobacterium aureum TaxID=995037 RepID=UPI000CF478A2|nr:Ig-like domain repeat protein [Cryobacterium aureum]